MKTFFDIMTVCVGTVVLACKSQSNQPNSDDHKKDALANSRIAFSTLDTPRSFVKNYGMNDSNRLFVFVGQKIWVERLPSKLYSFDNGFKAKYLVMGKIFGDFPSDTIEFVAYDHYGIPPFSKYQNSLLFVSADSGTYYHQKYMFNDVYKTIDGRWAGTYAQDDYEHDYNKRTKIKPVKIEFAENVAYPTKAIDDEGHQLSFSYPKPYFKTVGDSAFAVYGNYAEDLFKLKRDGYLTARKIFKNGKIIQ